LRKAAWWKVTTVPTAKIDRKETEVIAAETAVVTAIVDRADSTRVATVAVEAATKAAEADTAAALKRTLAIARRAPTAEAMIGPVVPTVVAAMIVRVDPGVIDRIAATVPKAEIAPSATRIKAIARTVSAKIGPTANEMTVRATITIDPGTTTTARAPKEKAAGIGLIATASPADFVRAEAGLNPAADSKRALAAANRADSGAALSPADSAAIGLRAKAATVRKVGLAGAKATASASRITGRVPLAVATGAPKMAVRAVDSAEMKKARDAATIDRPA
jgi:hypothetical protein